MRFLITAGGTREYIDPVRFISNASSGKMGFSLARAALAAGHRVTLIAATTPLKPPKGARLISVTTASQMFQAVKRYLPKSDCLVMAAAVSDYKVARPSRTKIKKTGQLLILRLRPTVDILRWAARNRAVREKIKNRLIVGFAMEDKDIRRRAQAKLIDKHLDMIVANTPTAIGANTSTLHVKTAAGPWVELPAASKAANARRIIQLIEIL
jgi:phosphopantothenoylcysteine decarboxylase/phosphopantothenate--cysteine ligase